jgi:putative spermidine/putrescine transport system ATP-binding protein
LAQVDTPQTIYNQPANSFVADFIGESTTLPLTHDGKGKLFFEDHLIATGFATDSANEWSLVIRPERLFASPEAIADSHETIVFSGVIREFVFQGDTAFALAAISSKYDLSMRFGTHSSESQNAMQPGDKVYLGLHRRDVIIIPS